MDTISRRDFLKISGAAAAAAFMAACAPRVEGGIATWGDTTQTELDKKMEESLGPNWKTQVINQLAPVVGASASEDSNSEQIAFNLLATAMASERALPSLMRDVRMGLLTEGDGALAQIIRDQETSQGLVKFYTEKTKGGFVVFDGERDSWWKFFRTKGDDLLEGYHNQALEIWRRNLALWGISGSELKAGMTEIKGERFLYYRLPNVGEMDVSTFIASNRAGSAEATASAVRDLVLGYFRESMQFIKDGQYGVVHYDMNATNLRLVEADGIRPARLVPIDPDMAPFAFTDSESAARLMGERLMYAWGGGKPGSVPYVNEADMARVMNEAFGREVWGPKMATLNRVRVRLPIDLSGGGNVHVRVFYLNGQFSGANNNTKTVVVAMEEAFKQATAVGEFPDVIHGEIPLIKGGSAPIELHTNAGGTSLRRLSGKNIKFAKLVEAIKPYARTALGILDIVATAAVVMDIDHRMRHPIATIDRTAIRAAETEKLVVRTSLETLVGQLKLWNELVARKVLDTEGGGKEYPELSNAIKILDRVTGIPISVEQWNDFLYNRGKYHDIEQRDMFMREYTEANVEFKGMIEELVMNLGPWAKLQIDGFSAIPLMPSGANGDMYVRLVKDSQTNHYTVTFGVAEKPDEKGNVDEIIPAFEIPLDTDQNGTIVGNPAVNILGGAKMYVAYHEMSYVLDTEDPNIELSNEWNNFILKMLFTSNFSSNSQQ